MARAELLVTPEELQAQLDGPERVVLLDVRWELSAGSQHAAYLAGHIPGARFVDLPQELAAPAAAPGGRHPLPDRSVLDGAMRRHGVSAAVPVVAYDGWGGLPAARAWWVLRDAGHPDVRVLDGGLAAWTAAGGPLATGAEPDPPSGDFTAQPGRLPALDAPGAAALAADPGALLLDVRASARFLGEEEPVDPVAGHIPGAVNLPDAWLTGPDGRLRPPGEIADMLAAAGGDAARGDATGPIGVYCGSGITAAHAVLALATAGIDAALYAGSWSDWISDPGRPTARRR